MSEYLLDMYNNHIWYDVKSNASINAEKIWFLVIMPDQPYFYVRPHRTDGPAVIDKYGSEFYYIEGKRHREDGPAVVYLSGDYRWYLNDVKYSFEEWCKELDKSKEEINFLKLKYNIN